ncbi:hypothetical protein [Altererythrobacter sp. BO-6]|uniref:hypothetical protein n=1 Tax=Altererythrobacter sp. BO-6 TaxID=2604537 RepID=UPI0019D27FED|nr:hypothetical protein [Altererythrobacter sp. BO-6]
MLAVLLSIWTGARVFMWEAPWPRIDELVTRAVPTMAVDADQERPQITAVPPSLPQRSDQPVSIEIPVAAVNPGNAAPPLVWQQPAAPPLQDAVHTAGGHQLLWMAAMSHLPVPRALGQQLAQVDPRSPVSGTRVPARDLPRVDRWSLDGWLLWREKSGRALAAPGRSPTYGASQAGAVLRYRLSPGSGNEPQAYTRAYRALIDGGESELAAGLSARPLPRVPLRAHAEVRVTQFSNSTELRPSAFVTTELPVARLPLGLRAEGYAQAGYVGGKAATAFADGQLHVMRSLEEFDLGQLSLGAAAWGGAQKGAERLDVGPSARLDLAIGKASARLSLDYRERVAGDAEPPSGVALTLSTRF